jgi:hypothetical protein
MQKQQLGGHHELSDSAQVAPSGTPTPQLMQQQQPPTSDPSNTGAAPQEVPHGAKSHVLFYRTSYKLSAQQVTLPRGIYPLAPGDSLGIQLYIAVHPQDWDSALYVTERTTSLRDARTAVEAKAHADTTGTGLSVAQDGKESTCVQPGNSSSSGVDACSGGSPQQGSCSPPPHSSSSNSSSSSQAPGTLQLGSLTAPVPADPLQRPQESLPPADPPPAAAAAAAAELPLADLALHHSPKPRCPPLQTPSKTQARAQQPQSSSAAAAAAASAAQGFGAQGYGVTSTLLGPFKALVKVQTGPKEGMCRLSKVQHAGQLKGIWHRPNHTVLLYEKVGSVR